MHLKTTLCFILLFIASIGFSQQQNNIDIALRTLENNVEKWDLVQKDIENPLVSDFYLTKHNGVTHVFLQQTIDGIAINGAISTINIKNGKPVFSNSKFISNAQAQVINSEASLDAQSAILAAVQEMDIQTSLTSLTQKNRHSDHHIVFEKPDFSNSDVVAKLVYQENENGQLVLVWDFSLDMTTNADYWSVRVNASTGKIVNKLNFTVYCSHDHKGFKNQNHDCAAHSIQDHKNSFKTAGAAIALADATYNVFALPAESPIHGPQVLTEDPMILSSSPLGWHATSSQNWTITRGNNVWAYSDTDGNDISDGTEPDGGTELFFDFAYDANAEPDALNSLAHVNLFYMVNMMHDITYALGFDEAAGNFQADNFGLGGIGGDYVEAEGQDGSGTNNANFATPNDGGNGRMQMFLWENTGGLLRINAPVQLEGFYDSGTADFGPDIILQDVDVEAECIVVNDGVGGNGGVVTDGCSEVMNDLTGKIAIVDRGSCFFSEKVYYSQQAGAVGVIICNIPGASTPGDDGNDAFGMAGADFSNEVTIPSLGVGKNTCDAIKLSLAAEIPVVAHIANHDVEGPDLLDGDFDNGVIAHEFGHGISNRLTGGPGNSGCLNNEEQMGEGWSDFFSLITTVEEGDQGTDARGIGNFASGETVNGNGIRNYPYSTDMSINPHTYNSIIGINLPHGLGEVWNVMIWDLYWAFVDLYGWDADWTNTESGNYKAVLLVMDGMKMQGCQPGFVDGRNGIIAADQVNFDGEHNCLIWEVFARRGLGYLADQGDSNDAGDGTENFDPLPTCIEKLKISKTATRLITAGDEIEVTIKVINHLPDVAQGVVVSDEMDSGTNYIDGSASMTANVTGNMISFDLGDMQYEDEVEITYRLSSDADNFSIASVQHDMEDLNVTNDFFEREPLSSSINFWNIVSSSSNSGERSWYVESIETESDQGLKTQPFVVSGDNPTLKFFHRFNTQGGADGGFVEVSVDGGPYNSLNEEFFENGYTSAIGYGTLAIPNLNGYTGEQQDWIASFADLSSFVGQNIQVRFRFASDDEINATGDQPGWSMDDFEIIDLVSYETTACVSANDGTVEECTDVIPTFVDSELMETSVVGVDSDHFGLSFYPNPASETVNLSISSKISEEGYAGIFGMDGKLLRSKAVSLSENAQFLSFDISSIPNGMYLIKVETNSGAITEKLIIQ